MENIILKSSPLHSNAINACTPKSITHNKERGFRPLSFC